MAGDEKLLPVRTQLEKKPFQRFMENYFLSLDGLTFEKEEIERSTGIKTVTVVDKFQHPYRIVDWNCNCEEQEKTGIPCAHQIMCVRQTFGKEYTDLITPRWLKQIPMRYKTNLNWLKPGKGARSRRNTHRKASKRRSN